MTSENTNPVLTIQDDTLSKAFFDARKIELGGRLKRGRFEHVLGVSKTAESLALLYDTEPRAACLAGLLHDWDKNYDDEGIRCRARELNLAIDPFVFKEMPQLLHGYTAAAALAREFPGLPSEIIQAIERHTAGAVGMTNLDMIVYVADALEPGRDYQGLDAIRNQIGVVSLEELYIATFRHVVLNLVERCKRIHPQTIEVWNHYIARSRSGAADKTKRQGKDYCERRKKTKN